MAKICTLEIKIFCMLTCLILLLGYRELYVVDVVMATLLLWLPYSMDAINMLLLSNPRDEFVDLVCLLIGISSFAVVPSMIARKLDAKK